MSGKKVISIRFHTDSKEDMELYEWLEQEAGISASLASVVKARLKDSYKKQEQQSDGLQDKIIAVVREEIQESGMKLVGAILSGMAGTVGTFPIVPAVEEDKLPEKSEDLPSGALDFLE